MKEYDTRHRRSRGSEIPRWTHHHLYDLDYERRFLGGLLTDPETARAAAVSLIAEHFFLPEHAVLFGAIRTIEADGVVPTGDRVAGLLADRGFLSAVPAITESLEDYIPSTDGPRLSLLAKRILALAGLRWLLRLADRADSTLRDRRLDGSSRIEAAHRVMSEALTDLGLEPRRLAA